MSETTNRYLEKSRMRQRGRELRTLLNEWDPLGVVRDGSPTDEYDCILWPVMRLLERGAQASEIAGYLKQELTDHFGSGPAFLIRRPTGFAKRLRTWFDAGWAGTRSL